MSRRKCRSPEASKGIYAEAYAIQQGEFYPEHHQANVQRLHRKYQNHSLAEVDEIYRRACRIDFEVQQQIKGAHLSDKAQEELLEWLEDHFFGFNRVIFLQAIERAQSR